MSSSALSLCTLGTPLPGGYPAGYSMLFDANTGITKSGSNVTVWADQSANANNLSGTGTFNAGNGQNYVSFNGTSETLNGAATGLPSGAATRTVFTLCRFRSSALAGFVYGQNTGSTGTGFGLTHNGGNLYFWGFFADRGTSSNALNSWIVYEVQYDGTNVIQLRDGTQIDSTATSLNTSTTTTHLGYHPAVGQYAQYDLAVALVYPGINTSRNQQIRDLLTAQKAKV